MVGLLAWVLAVVPGAQPALKLAAPSWNAVSVAPERAQFFSDYFARELDQRGMRVITQSEMASLMGYERQRQLMGCTQESSTCLAELGGALGVDGIINGSVAKLDQGYAVSLKVLRVKDAQAMGTYSTKVRSDDELLDWLARTARGFAVSALGPAAETVNAGGGSGVMAKAWIPVGVVGLAAGGVGAGLYAVSRSNIALLQNKSPSIDSAAKLQQVSSAADLQQTLGVALMVTGGAALAAASGLFAWSRSTSASVSWTPEAGAAVWVRGEF